MINQIWYIHSMNIYKNEQMIDMLTWKISKGIMLTKIGQAQKAAHNVTELIGHFGKDQVQGWRTDSWLLGVGRRE